MTKERACYPIIIILTLATLISAGCAHQASTPINSDSESTWEIPVVIHIDGLRFEAKDSAVIKEILGKIQEKTIQCCRFVLVDDEEKARKRNPYVTAVVNYTEEPAGSYCLDGQGYYRLCDVKYRQYTGTNITCSIYIDGERLEGKYRRECFRKFPYQKVNISATTSETLIEQNGKEPEMQLYADAVANLWAKLEQFPTFINSVVQSKPQFESSLFDTPDVFGTTHGGIVGLSGQYLLVNPSSGVVPWSPMSVEFDYLSLLEVVGNKAYLCYPGNETAYYCIDTVTGFTWEFVAPYIGSWSALTELMRVMDVKDGTAYIYYADKIYALDADSGKKKWEYKYRLGGGFFMPGCPFISGGCLYYGGGGKIVALDITDGHEKWVSPGGPSWAKADGDLLYAIQDALVAFDADTGKVVWSQQLDRTGTFWWSWSVVPEVGCEPLVAGGEVFAVQCYGYDGTKRLEAYDAETGLLKWQSYLTAPDDSQSEPPNYYQIMDPIGEIVVVNYDYGLVAFDIDTGRKVWTFSKKDSYRFVPATATTNTILVNDGGMLRAIDVSNGKGKWAFQWELDVYEHKGASLSYWEIWSDKMPLAWAANGLVFITYEKYNEGTSIVALDETTGEEKWRLLSGVSIIEVADGLVYALGYVNLGDTEYGIWVIDALTGQIKSYFPTGLVGKVINGTVYMTNHQDVPSLSAGWYVQVIRP